MSISQVIADQYKSGGMKNELRLLTFYFLIPIAILSMVAFLKLDLRFIELTWDLLN